MSLHQYTFLSLLILFGFFSVVSASSDADNTINFPPQLDADDIRYYSETHDIDGLHWALTNVFRRSSRNPKENEIVYGLPQLVVAKGGGNTYTTEYKLAMDLEQAEYIVQKYSETDPAKAEFFQTQVIPKYKAILGQIPPLEQLDRTGGLYAFRTNDVEDTGILDVYNKANHVTDFDELKDPKTGRAISLLSDTFDANKIEAQWFGEDEEYTTPGVVVIDNLLSPEALNRIRQLLLESTVFFQTKMPLKFGGYAGAYIDDGLHDRILIALAFELNKALPRIMKDNPLKYLWAYKYDSEYTGISTHADQAAINVNIWITPDDASLDKSSGGLVIYTAKPPPDADFQSYNTNTEKLIKEIIEPTNFANVTVPYRENRAVLFDSALFHHTDSFKFKKGYTNRRINLTILYGDMQRAEEVRSTPLKSEL